MIIKDEGNYKESLQLPSISEYSALRLSYVKAVEILAFTTAICFPLHSYIELSFGHALSGCRDGLRLLLRWGPGIVASVLSVLSFDYFIVAPVFP